MVPLDRWVIKHVCRYIKSAREYDARRIPPLLPDSYSVNLSGLSLTDEGMLDHIITQFSEYNIDPHQVSFEITETAIVANLPKAQDFIGQLRKLGCKFSLDDFGSGLSSFAYLQSLPVDYLKIDGAFIRGIASNKINRALVRSINEVGHVMGMKTVAEYVEDGETLDIVRELGIDYAQGFAVGPVRQLTST